MLSLPVKVISLGLCPSWEYFSSTTGFLEITPELRDFAGMGNVQAKHHLLLIIEMALTLTQRNPNPRLVGPECTCYHPNISPAWTDPVFKPSAGKEDPSPWFHADKTGNMAMLLPLCCFSQWSQLTSATNIYSIHWKKEALKFWEVRFFSGSSRMGMLVSHPSPKSNW